MTALLLVHIKLIVLFLLIGSIVALARLGGGKPLTARSKRRRTASVGL
jgi:hypothetical protein